MTDNTGFCLTRRGALVSGPPPPHAATLPAALPADARPLPPEAPGATVPVSFTVNGRKRTLTLDPRVTLLDALREHLALTGSKKGCDHGQCGACTVMVEGKRINSCLTLAVMQRRRQHHHHRGTGQARRPPPDAGRVRAPRRLSVRLLHARTDPWPRWRCCRR